MKRALIWLLLLPAAPLVAQGDPRATIFITRGCTECHAITDLGVRARTDAGPDLSYAAEEAPIRYGVSLRAFLASPTGVMEMVLVTHVRIGVPDRDSIVAVLERLECERRGHPQRFVELPH